MAGTIAEGERGLITVNFTSGNEHAQLGENLAIRLVNLNLVDVAFPDSHLEVDFDDVNLTASAVPELSAAALLLLGGLAIFGGARRRLR